MTSVALTLHPERAEASSVAHQLIDWLLARDHEVCLLADDAEVLGRPDIAVPDDNLGDGADLAVLIDIAAEGMAAYFWRSMVGDAESPAERGVPSLGMHLISWREGKPVLVFSRQLVESE